MTEKDYKTALRMITYESCKVAGVNVEEWLTYFLDHVHEYDNDYSRDLAELLPYALEAKGILKKSETLATSSENL